VGDEVLKTSLSIILLLCIIPVLALAAQEKLSLGNDMTSYDKIFEKIAEQRIGADILTLEKLDNPFVREYADGNGSDSNSSAPVTVYLLEATFNQKAKINGMWYKRYDTVGAYKLTKINHDGVILRNEIEKKELLIRKNDESNIKIFSK